MVTILTDHETQRSVWVPKLIEWAEQGRDHYAAVAETQRRNAAPKNAEAYTELADKWQTIADRARVLLVDMSEPTTNEPPAHNHTSACQVTDCADWITPQAVGLADACAAEEPPHQLVPFVDWLRLRFGALLPGLSVETWQAIGCLILMARGIRP